MKEQMVDFILPGLSLYSESKGETRISSTLALYEYKEIPGILLGGKRYTQFINYEPEMSSGIVEDFLLNIQLIKQL
jgi:hypothetical protein